MEKPGWRKKADCIGRRWKKEEKEGRTSKFGEEERGQMFSHRVFSRSPAHVYIRSTTTTTQRVHEYRYTTQRSHT